MKRTKINKKRPIWPIENVDYRTNLFEGDEQLYFYEVWKETVSLTDTVCALFVKGQTKVFETWKWLFDPLEIAKLLNMGQCWTERDSTMAISVKGNGFAPVWWGGGGPLPASFRFVGEWPIAGQVVVTAATCASNSSVCRSSVTIFGFLLLAKLCDEWLNAD